MLMAKRGQLAYIASFLECETKGSKLSWNDAANIILRIDNTSLSRIEKEELRELIRKSIPPVETKTGKTETVSTAKPDKPAMMVETIRVRNLTFHDRKGKIHDRIDAGTIRRGGKILGFHYPKPGETEYRVLLPAGKPLKLARQ